MIRIICKCQMNSFALLYLTNAPNCGLFIIYFHNFYSTNPFTWCTQIILPLFSLCYAIITFLPNHFMIFKYFLNLKCYIWMKWKSEATENDQCCYNNLIYVLIIKSTFGSIVANLQIMWNWIFHTWWKKISGFTGDSTLCYAMAGLWTSA